MVTELLNLERRGMPAVFNMPMRVELQIASGSKLLSAVKTMGELRKRFSSLEFVKYIYLDPKDNVLKGRNPLDDVPLVENAHITVAGDLEDIIKFTKAASSQ